MYQTLFHIPREVSGLPLFGAGVLLAAWAVFSVGLLLWLAWRQGWTADTRSYVPLLLLVGAAIWLLLPALCDEHGLPIRSYGVMLLVAVVSGVALAVRRAVRAGLDPDVILGLAFWMFIPGIIGARTFYVIEYWENFLRPTPDAPCLGATLGAIINVSEGGLVVYGSLIGGLPGLLLYARKHRLPLLALGDLIAPSMVLGLALGRIGCLLNGCCYGGPCDVPWAVTFPPESPPYKSQVQRGQMHGFEVGEGAGGGPAVVRVEPGSPAEQAGLKPGDRLGRINGFEPVSAADAHSLIARAFYGRRPLELRTAEGRELTVPAAPVPARSLRVHPSQVYSAISALLLCLFLLAYDPYCRRDGQLFAAMLTIYPVLRFLLEIIRTDEGGTWPVGLSISQNVSLLVLAAAAALWVHLLRRPAHREFWPAVPGDRIHAAPGGFDESGHSERSRLRKS